MVHLAPGLNRIAALLLALLLFSCKEKPPQLSKLDASKLKISMNGPLTLVNGKPANAILYTFYPNGDTMELVTFRNGRENGVSKSFYPNKQLRELRFFVNGWKEGEHKGWYANGKQAFIYQFKNDMFEGSYKEWTETGILFRDMNYLKGQEDGRQTVRYADGKIKSNYVIKNGVRYGLLGTKNCINVSDSIFTGP